MKPAKNERSIQISGDLDFDTYTTFSTCLSALEEQSSTLPVYVELISKGGCAYTGLAIYERIRLSPCKIIVCGTGMIASAATIILAAGDRRLMTENAWAMVHEEVPEVVGNVTECENEIRHHRNMENQWNAILTQHTNWSQDKWEAVNLQNYYMTAAECLEAGLIDEIVRVPNKKVFRGSK